MTDKMSRCHAARAYQGNVRVVIISDYKNNYGGAVKRLSLRRAIFGKHRAKLTAT
jgi:hypothetical protein